MEMNTQPYPGRSAARSAPVESNWADRAALQTRDRNKHRAWNDPGPALHHYVLQRIREMRL
jgi:hypothetical protein